MLPNLKNIVYVVGESGLYKILSSRADGLVLQFLGKKSIVLKLFSRVKIILLQDITICHKYGGALHLMNFYENLYKNQKGGKLVEDFSDKNIIRGLFEIIMPDYDRDRVKDHDIKKIFSWYNLLVEHMPETFGERV